MTTAVIQQRQIRTLGETWMANEWQRDDWRPLPRTWQECCEELARPEIDPERRTQVELRLENIRRGSC